MNTRTLQTLVQLARTPSFRETAAHLNLTLSAVSMQMKTLEAELGIILFDRAHRPPRMTPAARGILVHARSLLEHETALIRECAGEDVLAGQYRLGFIATSSVRLLPVFLERAKKHAPKAVFQIETGLSEILETRVSKGALDAAVVTARDVPIPNLEYRTLVDEPLVYAEPEEPTTQLPFLQFNPSSGIGRLIASHIKRHRPSAGRSPIILDSVEAIMGCVNAGLGYTLLAKPDVERYAVDGIRTNTPEETLQRTVVLASERGSFSEKALESLVKLIRP